MKAKIISWSLNRGGASIAAYRLFLALMKYEKKDLFIDLHVNHGNSISKNITRPENNIHLGWNLLRRYFGNKLQMLQATSNPTYHSSSLLPCNMHKLINKSDFNIINLHWFQGEMLSIKNIKLIKKPIIFTLHDCWAFLGSEHYPNGYSDNRYIEGYTNKNKPLTHKGIDLDKICWEMKKKYWSKKYQIICPSNWLAQCAKKSKLMHSWPIDVIPNPVPINIYKPISKNLARKILNLNPNKKYILFGALKITSDSRKGWDLLQAALKKFSSTNSNSNTEVLIFGENEPKNYPKLGIKINYLGRIYDEKSLALIYSAADVMVVPSRMENLPQTATEAQSCGTPVVAFDCSGFKDVILHKKTGFLAKAFEIESLAEGMMWILNKKDKRQIGINARKRATSLWDPYIIANEYKKIYLKTIDKFDKNLKE